MLSVEEAQARIFDLAPRLPATTLPLAQANGRYLAAPVEALRTQPARDLSAMDGYAMRADDPSGPWSLIGESAAGTPFNGLVQSGQCIRISTGAVVPDDCDAILLQENVEVAGDTILLHLGENGPTPRHIRRAGMDFAKGATLIHAGTKLTPARIALAAMGGHATVPCGQVPKVAFVETGDELVPPGTSVPKDNQIPATNALMLAAMVERLPCIVTTTPPLPDRLDVITAHFQSLVSSGTDIIVSIGGASVGDHDLIKPALEQLGAKVDFWKVAMRPGKPLMAARLGHTLFLGLPGNPVSAFVTGWLFLLPAIRHMAGSGNPILPPIRLPIEGNLPENGPRRYFIRGHAGPTGVRNLDSRDSSAMHELSMANCLIERPEGAPSVSEGMPVKVHFPQLD